MDRAGFYPRVAAFLCETVAVFLCGARCPRSGCAGVSSVIYKLRGFRRHHRRLRGDFVIVFALLEGLGLGTPGKTSDAACRSPPTMARGPRGDVLWRRVAVKYMPALQLLFPAVLLCLTDPLMGRRSRNVVQYGPMVGCRDRRGVRRRDDVAGHGGLFQGASSDGRAMHDVAARDGGCSSVRNRGAGFHAIIARGCANSGGKSG